jgi:putative component of membrane protein insertase Oxa1/YidC/SpoIIIJ protein YidD
MRFSLLLLLITTLAAEEPWGPDSSLVTSTPVTTTPSKFGLNCISYFQEVISPIDGIRSSFRPSSSEYTKQALQLYGFFPGIALGCDRLLRENGDPWVYRTIPWESFTMKYDPVDK